MRQIQGQTFSAERALYGETDLQLINCAFQGDEDGESALKETKNIIADDCVFKLRYPLWHGKNLTLKDCEMTETCRAALWYSDDIKISKSKLFGIKALRECSGAYITESRIVSPEFGWKCKEIRIEKSRLESEYAFLLSENLCLDDVKFIGKYSFQYIKNAELTNCVFDTKDAFWHAENVTVRDSVVNGEYLGWYSENLTFINCKIIGIQPLCYCKGLKLINCRTQNCDLSFEYSDVEAEIEGDILSIKNPVSGIITADSVQNVILTQDSKYPCNCKIVTKKIV